MIAHASWPARAVAEHALRQVEARLAGAADDAGAHFERACLLDQLGHDIAARQAYLDVLARDMGHAGALLRLASLLIRCGFTTAARTVLEQAACVRPGDASIRASLGHLLREAGETQAARLQYEAALRLEPQQPEAHQGMSYLLDGIDEPAAERHRQLGFAGRALSVADYRGERQPVVVLRLVCARGGNVPTRLLLDDRIFLTHTLVADHACAGIALPAHDLAFNAIGDAERCGQALDAADRLLSASGAPVINPPGRIRPTTRTGNSVQLGLLAGVIAPRLLTVPRASLGDGLPSGFGFPVLLRSPGFHTGENFVRVEGEADLAQAVQGLPGEALHVIEPLDASDAAGVWRKYRVMLVGGRILPLHLAISGHWKVHHFTAGMARHPVHRAEEAAFLDDMPGVLGAAAMAALGRIDAALGLDYGGIDFALGRSGEVLLFEANATMTLVAPPPDPIWDYRRAAFECVVQAVRDLIMTRAGRTDCVATAPR